MALKGSCAFIMPFDIFKVGNPSKPFCVFKVNPNGKRTGKRFGCHTSRRNAALQIAAIEAEERKSMSENGTEVLEKEEKEKTEEKHSTVISFVPFGATTFADVEEFQISTFTNERIKELTRQLQDLISNIMFTDNIEDKGAALDDVIDEFTTRTEAAIERGREPGFIERLFGKKELIPKPEETKEKINFPDDMGKRSFMIWKEGDRTRYLTIYSNKYRDRDNPPEILAEQAHIDFHARVDNKEVAYPELWLWHVDGTRFGQADWVAYDKDNGFSLASGLIDKGKEAIAVNLAGVETLVSHGMPIDSIQRDEKDETIITRYDSKEISVLPDFAAANLLTDFVILKESDMGIPEDKLDFLKDAGLSDEDLQELNDSLKAKGKQAEGLEFKEGKKKEDNDPVKDPVLEDETEVEEVAAATSPSVEEISEAIVDAVSPIKELVEKNAAAIAVLTSDETERIKEVAAATPAASLSALVTASLSATKSSDTVIEKDDPLTKKTPPEAKAKDEGPTSLGFVNDIIADSEKEK